MATLDLTTFGFTPTESLVYEVLLRGGPGTGYAIARRPAWRGPTPMVRSKDWCRRAARESKRAAPSGTVRSRRPP